MRTKEEHQEILAKAGIFLAREATEDFKGVFPHEHLIPFSLYTRISAYRQEHVPCCDVVVAVACETLKTLFKDSGWGSVQVSVKKRWLTRVPYFLVEKLDL